MQMEALIFVLNLPLLHLLDSDVCGRYSLSGRYLQFWLETCYLVTSSSETNVVISWNDSMNANPPLPVSESIWVNIPPLE